MIKIGEKLQEERKKKGLTLEQVAKATKIRPSFLQAIEESKYEKLPGSSYAHGFVKNYLEFLDLPTKEYLAVFRREYDENEHRTIIPGGMVGKENIPLGRFSIKQAVWLGIVVILALSMYLFYQYRAAFFNPFLSVVVPKENSMLSSQTVIVSGSTDANTAVTINSLPAYIDANNTFTKEIPVFPGNVTFVVKAVNSFGKITTVERHIKVTVGQ